MSPQIIILYEIIELTNEKYIFLISFKSNNCLSILNTYTKKFPYCGYYIFNMVFPV